uniref:Uncharacterized protein n=1 Tax=Spongospora subterranea TaxID=70186 RepID=A0A0H5R001_9EUKA|eukprot:CRZ07483.1 hypothetical protein [Spongospora subterranea]
MAQTRSMDADSDQGANPAYPQPESIAEHVIAGQTPIFFPLKPPIIKAFDPKAIAVFRRERESYLALITERRELHGDKVQPVSLKSSFDLSKLKAISKYVLKKPVDQLTDSDLDVYLKKLQEQATEHCHEATIRKQIIMNLSLKNPAERVLAYFAQFDDFIADHALEHVFKDDEGIKLKLNTYMPEFDQQPYTT